MTYYRLVPLRNNTKKFPIKSYFLYNIVIQHLLEISNCILEIYLYHISTPCKFDISVSFIPIMLIKVIQYCVRFLWHYKKDITSIESDMIVWERTTFYDRMGSAKI